MARVVYAAQRTSLSMAMWFAVPGCAPLFHAVLEMDTPPLQVNGPVGVWRFPGEAQIRTPEVGIAVQVSALLQNAGWHWVVVWPGVLQC